MIRIIIAFSVLSVATEGVLPEDLQTQIVNYVNNNDGSGNYNFAFRTSNGLAREETGSVVNQGQEDQYIKVYGSYSYIDTNDQTVYVRYRADKDGYHIEAKEVPIIGLPPAAVATLLG
ncbi:hypothetical protein HF086_010744 [Spodoptera exigua]|uniref:Uncharacterized protein n=1 Tax=Spodoptera exigua TaxID=7107 RepID=A0A922M0R0_SPOEX|nr:hypothetical protein HF086_010744 [Spodoptera exigua]